ncbi:MULTISPECIES: invasion associated locus B family protein [Agrobacterium tumefaciens complex]|jgi:invasion protein IalB|uniref:invasion associated locus B family protein n=1 Tax=Agrobacterium TaxID=357 RepID=UPI0010EDCAC7|nr:invasion protein IalB [Agrobacterium radiobacter]MBP2537223.1 invasion protein IalB [Agrobacterium tumefaciens]MCP2137382.1 invasion protein IalB [Rhizobium sp. SLBN-94]MBB4452284.1 invasion protein IalB [Agrobacterium radiobacter]MDP9789399.1 invasion protein IalB [Agrobacterium tumefaciens]
MPFRPNMSRNAALAVAVFAGAMAGDAGAQEAANPAVPLHEVHGSWQLACAAPVKKDPADPNTTETAPAKPLCAIAQVQLEEKPRKLVVSVEFRLDDSKTPGQLSGTIVMPFGLAVTKLFSIKSDNVRLQEVQVSTCLPVGCVVSFAPFVELISALDRSPGSAGPNRLISAAVGRFFRGVEALGSLY